MASIDRKRVAIALIAPAALTLLVVGAIYLAHQVSLDRHRGHMELLAGEVLRQAEVIREQLRQAFTALEASSTEPCSEGSLALMRSVAIRSDRLAGVGYVKDDELRCSSFGRHDPALQVGSPDFDSFSGVTTRRDRRLAIGPETRLLLATAPSGYTGMIHPRLVFTPPAGGPSISLAVITRSTRQFLVSYGPVDHAWSADAERQASGWRLTDAHLVAWRHSSTWPYAGYAAIPADVVSRDAERLALLLVPLCLAVGGVLMLICRYAVRRNSTMQALLRAGLRRNELVVHYQPIVDIRSGRWVGAEALLRWRRPGGEWVSPAVFIPLAEKHGLMHQVTMRVMRTALAEMAPLARRFPDFFFSLNMTASDLLSPTVARSLRELVARYGILPQNIHIELTEREIVDTEPVERAIAALRAFGCRIAADDFGVGYSNLAYLDRLHLDYLKIDRVFLARVDDSETTKQTICHIIEMAQERGIKLIAEGIETARQLEFLKARHVELGQGWFFARAKPIAEFERRYATQRADAVAKDRAPAVTGGPSLA